MRPPAQPQISGGSTSPSGGSSHSGRLSVSSNTATTETAIDHAAACQPEAPRRISRPGNRRLATSDTMAGVIRSATSSSDSITTMGTAKMTMIKGATMARRPSAPIDSSQRSTASLSVQCERAVCTPSTASPQNHQPRPSTAPPASSTGASDSSITRGCRQ